MSEVKAACCCFVYEECRVVLKESPQCWEFISSFVIFFIFKEKHTQQVEMSKETKVFFDYLSFVTLRRLSERQCALRFVWQVQLCEFVQRPTWPQSRAGSLMLGFTANKINVFFLFFHGKTSCCLLFSQHHIDRWFYFTSTQVVFSSFCFWSSRWTCGRWCKRQACSFDRSRRPSSPHRWYSKFRYSRTPGVRLSRPGVERITKNNVLDQLHFQICVTLV